MSSKSVYSVNGTYLIIEACDMSKIFHMRLTQSVPLLPPPGLGFNLSLFHSYVVLKDHPCKVSFVLLC